MKKTSKYSLLATFIKFCVLLQVDFDFVVLDNQIIVNLYTTIDRLTTTSELDKKSNNLVNYYTGHYNIGSNFSTNFGLEIWFNKI